MSIFDGYGKAAVLCVVGTLYFAVGGEQVSAQPGGPVPDGQCTLPATIAGQVTLKPGCTYHQMIEIERSGVMVDCRGATIEGNNTLMHGISIGAARGISDVTVKNCKVANTRGAGIYLMSQTPAPNSQSRSVDHAQYALAPSNISLQSVVVQNARSVGIYVGHHVTGVSLMDSQIIGSGGVGLYLDFSSRKNIIVRNKFIGNGVVSKREAIAVDSSAYNRIERNIFQNNPFGGIYLYKNCGERSAKKLSSPVRYQPSEYNQIIGNIIRSSNVGIWVASRQSKNISYAQCSDGYYFEGKYAVDKANNNTVSGNKIFGVDKGIIIEDDDNSVTRNIVSSRKVCISVGTPYRSKVLKRPVRNATVDGNQCTTPGGVKPIDVIFDSVGTKVSNNRQTRG